jgi:acyl-CoA dehydrogenase
MANQTFPGWPFCEAAHRDDAAVQLQSGDGVRCGHIGEILIRESCALRIYAGATDVQKVAIARAVLDGQSG